MSYSKIKRSGVTCDQRRVRWVISYSAKFAHSETLSTHRMQLRTNRSEESKLLILNALALMQFFVFPIFPY